YLIRRNAIRSFDASLQGRAMSVAALIRYSEDAHPELQFDSALVPQPLTKGTPDLFRIESQDGHVLASSTPSLPNSTIRASVWEFSFANSPYRALQLLDVPVLDSEGDRPRSAVTLNVIYAASTQELQGSLARLFISILIGGIVLLGISAYASV